MSTRHTAHSALLRIMSTLYRHIVTIDRSSTIRCARRVWNIVQITTVGRCSIPTMQAQHIPVYYTDPRHGPVYVTAPTTQTALCRVRMEVNTDPSVVTVPTKYRPRSSTIHGDRPVWNIVQVTTVGLCSVPTVQAQHRPVYCNKDRSTSPRQLLRPLCVESVSKSTQTSLSSR